MTTAEVTELARATGSEISEHVLGLARASVRDVFHEALRPDRSAVAHIGMGDTLDVRSAGVHVTPAEDYYYRSLPAHMREYRKPESDHWCAEWIRGLSNLDGRGYERMRNAEDRLAKFGGQRAVLAEQTITAVSGLATGTGGAFIPLPLWNSVVKARDRIAKIRQLATKFVSSANSLRIPVSAIVTVAIANEGAVAADGAGALTSKLLSKRKIQGNFSATVEMVGDSAINLVTYFSERVGSAIGAFEDTEICTTPGGSAVRFSEGLASATITSIAPAPPTQINYAGLLAMFYAVPQQYRSGACWLVETSVLALISQIKTTTGQPLFIPIGSSPSPVTDVTPGSVGRVLGLPVYDVPLAAGTMFLGDPSYIGLLDGGGIELRTSEHALWTTDSIAYRFTQRTDSVVMLENAFRKMVGITTVG
jgi:HK97 family phage major capsid protein